MNILRVELLFAGTGDLVRCYKCGKTIHGWKPGDDPVSEHRNLFPDKDCVDNM